jgi:divinyl protochlorophyllide a 8-vinyl-reductase
MPEGAAPGHVVGPNAILQTAEALRAEGGAPLARAVFDRAGLGPMLDAPPTAMVPERDAAALHRAVAETLAPERAAAVAQEGGRLTGAYILAHRIPAPAQRLLRALPAALAGPLLLSAIRRHAWTFAGSGRVTIGWRPMDLVITANPLATPGCPWHRAVLQTLFRRLVAPDIRVVETACCAYGAAACRFEMRRGGAGPLTRPEARPEGDWESGARG